MKLTKKWLSVLLCVMVFVAALAVTANAAGGATNVAFAVEKTEVNVGDTFTVTFSNKAMTVKGFTAGFTFDKTLLKCVSIVGVDPDYPNDYSLISDGGRGGVTYTEPTAVSTVDKANENGTVGYAYIGTSDEAFLENTLLIVTFEAKATGTANFTLYEETNGTDAFKSDSIETKIVAIKAAAPACTHETTKLVPNDNGTHNVVCANAECNHVVNENVACTGTDDGDCTTAVNCECGNVITEAKAAHEAGEDDGDCTTAVKCANCEKNAVEAKAAHVAGEDDGDCTTAVKCVNCEKNAVEGAKEHAFNSKPSNELNTPADCENAATYFVQCDNCDAVSKQHFVKVDEANGHGSVNGFGYATNNNGTHNVVCKDCSKAIEEKVPCTDKDGDEKCDLCGYNMHVCVHDHYETTATTHQSYCSCGKAIGEAEPHSYNHTTRDFECECGAKYTGWSTSYAEDVPYTCYVKNGEVLYGWNEVEGAWYYFNTTSGNRATGLERVPYPTVEINGVKYGPNADDKAYWEAHKDTSKYSDATTAMFIFDENGKFQQTTGIVNNNRYAVNGMIGWHVGLVEIEGEYYYFKGDVDGGGNIMATGNIYVSRNTTKLEVKLGGIYTFAADGKLCKYNGVTKIGEVLCYYDNYRLATDAGLIKNGEGYSYVRTSGDKAGQLVVGRTYWVHWGTTNGLMAGGKYTFDANGLMMLDGDEQLNGIVEIDGVFYYYKGGVKQSGAGVVKLTDDAGETFYIYVRSDGRLATGKYWPTNTNDLLERGEYDWGTNGKYYPGK